MSATAARDFDVIEAPPTDVAKKALEDMSSPFPGNASFSMGGAVLVPFANRIRGKLLPDGTEIETKVLGETVRLPANFSGKLPGAERCAIHGLALMERVTDISRERTADADVVRASIDSGDFGGHWLSDARVEYRYELSAERLTLTTTVTNVGSSTLPVGLGWHPYFNIPSGKREQVTLHVPARHRLVVDNYDDVFPTGEIVPVQGTRYDFRSPDGAPLAGNYYDDAFVDLLRDQAGDVVIELHDHASGYGVAIRAGSPFVTAVQVYAPPDKSYVAIEPQFNVTDPFGSEWPAGTNTGMVSLAPGESVAHEIRVEPLESQR